MTELGGTTTQSGILYQNSVAALYLGRLIDSRAHPPSERVAEVRVEAPEHVDDIVLRHGNGSRTFIQAKENLATRGDPWIVLWKDFASQLKSGNATGEKYVLVLTVGNYTEDIGALRETCDRAGGKINAAEWWNALSERHREIANKVLTALPSGTQDTLFSMLTRTRVHVWPLSDIEQFKAIDWMPPATAHSVALFQAIRDKVGGWARVRATFRTAELLDRLRNENGITVADAPEWGADAYRKAMATAFGRVAVPGTTLAGPIEQLFMWLPLRTRANNSPHRDFEEEDLRWRRRQQGELVKLELFPRGNLRRVVISAGAGSGKSTLLSALAHRLSSDGTVFPAIVSLDDLVARRLPIVDYLRDVVNADFSVRLDWYRLCESGRAAILFDGLDELNANDRSWVLRAISFFGGRFPDVAFLLTVRDSAMLATPLGVPVVEFDRLDDMEIERFASNYLKAGARVDPVRIRGQATRNPDLGRLLRIPLFLALVLATVGPEDDLPSSRTELLESYLSILLRPEEHKPSSTTVEQLDDSREIAEFLAFRGLEAGSLGLSEFDAKRYLPDMTRGRVDAHMDRLIRIGLIRRSRLRLQFAYPIVQEYLAACWLLQHRQEDVERRLPLVIRRPWAQTIQFALERHPEANRIIQESVNLPDDAYYTVLRLMTRCIINGANVTSEVRARAGKRLATAWTSESDAVRISIGRLIRDGFLDSLPELAIEHLVSGKVLDEDGAAILVAKADAHITRRVLAAYISRHIAHPYLHGWQEAVNDIALDALDMYLERARAKHTSEDELANLASYIQELPNESIPADRWRSLSTDETLPSLIRITGHAFGSRPTAVGAWLLMDEALVSWVKGDMDSSVGYFAAKMFRHMDGAAHHLASLVRNQFIPLKAFEDIARSIMWNTPEELAMRAFLYAASGDATITEKAFVCLTLAGVCGNEEAAVHAANLLAQQPFENVYLWCGYSEAFPKPAIDTGVSNLILISLADDDFINIIVNLPSLLGRADALAASLALWVRQHVDRMRGNTFKHLLALATACNVGFHDFFADVEREMDSLTSRSSMEFPEASREVAEQAICEALTCLDERSPLEQSRLWNLFGKWGPGVDYSVVTLVISRADERSMLRLVDLYGRDEQEHLRQVIFTGLERVAGRHGKRVICNVDVLELRDW
jgi:hypothetical protein